MKNGALLSPEFKVAAEIYEYNERKENVWFNKLVKSLESKKGPSKATVAKALNSLFDWGIVKGEYGETERGRAGRLLFITNESRDLIGEIDRKFWRK